MKVCVGQVMTPTGPKYIYANVSDFQHAHRVKVRAPNLKEFMEQHFNPHYTTKCDENGVVLSIQIFDNINVPEYFSHNSASIHHESIQDTITKHLADIMAKTHHDGILMHEMQEFIGKDINNAETLAFIRDRATMILKNAIQKYYGSVDGEKQLIKNLG